MLNLKYQPHKHVCVTASYVIFTNHLKSIAIPIDDRRLTVLSNPEIANSTTYFTKLNVWLEETDEHGEPIWAGHIYRWLKAREVTDPERLMMPLNTEAKSAMAADSLTGVAKIVSFVARNLIDKGIYFMTSGQLEDIVNLILVELGDPRAGEYKDSYLRNCYNDATTAFQHWRIRPTSEDSPQRVRVFKHAVKCGLIPDYPSNGGKYSKASELPDSLKALAANNIGAINAKKICEAVITDLHGAA